ncbi:MAG: PQQ-binding-like beta-propeller repeat protein [Flavobacteriales bacterium]|nr:PQQ-binding-like beta-propeller repeat protein [Flavobacteriales bacterium]
MQFRTIWMLVASAAFLFTSCKKDPHDPDPTTLISSSDHLVDVQGSVIGPGGAFLASASVECNGLSTTTDSRGVFRLRDVPVQEGSNFVRVRANGYFNGGRNFQVIGAEDVSVRVKLLPKVEIGSFSATSGGQASTAEGLAVSIPANSIADGYQGTVHVYATYIDPTSITGVTPFPGMEGTDTNGDAGVLISYGMGHVVLEDGGGNVLQLADGSTAQLTIPVPTASQGAAPQTIPFWYFDEAAGHWQEEGSAQLQGASYVGDVAHFSLWNCDDFVCYTTYNVRVSCSGEPYAYLPVQVVYNSGVVQGPWDTRLTSSTGYLNVSLPCYGNAELYAFAPGSDEQLLIGTIGLVDGNGEVQDLQMDALCGPRGAVHGSAVDGNGQPVTNGYVYLNYGSYFTEPIFFNDQGDFNAFYYALDDALWNTDAQLVGWDLDQYITVQGPVVQFNSQVNVLSAPLVFGGGAASVNGRVYVAGVDSGFHCLDAVDGSRIWSWDVGAMEDEVSPIFANNLIVFRNLSGLQYAANAFDGSQVWTGFDSDGNSPATADGMLFFATQSGTIRARNASDGSSVWTYSAGAGLYSNPTVMGNVLYCGKGTADPGIVALDKTTGTLLWEYATPSDVNTSPCVADGKVFFGSDDQEFYALDANDGTLLWQTSIDDCLDLWRCPTAGNGIVYVQACSELHALDMSTGADIWSMAIVSGAGGNDPYLYDGKLYVGGSTSAPGWFHCLDATTGTVIWNIETTGLSAAADYCLAANNVLLIHQATSPRSLEARNATTGQVIWTSPVQDGMVAPMVLVDDNGVAHYTTNSGMQQ